MKKTNTFACAALMALALAGCKGNKEEKNNADAETQKATTEQTAQAEQTEQAEQEFTSPVLKFFELKGHVMSCVLERDDSKEATYEFDEEGYLSKYVEEHETISDIEYDDQMRIASMTKQDAIGREYADVYEYNADGTVSKASCDAMPDGLAYEHKFVYTDGRLTSKEGWSDGPGNLTITYKYLEEDSNGNWTLRECATLPEGETEPYVITERRTITYY